MLATDAAGAAGGVGRGAGAAALLSAGAFTGALLATEEGGVAGSGTATEPFLVARSAAELSRFNCAVWPASAELCAASFFMTCARADLTGLSAFTPGVALAVSAVGAEGTGAAL